MSNINFKPWVGKSYHLGYNGKRLLVLGESHYCQKELAEGGRCHPECKKENMLDDCFSQTKDVIEDFVYNYCGDSYQQTFLCFERAVAGRELSQQEREHFWNSIMFYNYVQYSLAMPRTAPLPKHWVQSEQAFKELLHAYQPNYIIAWGVRLYDALPDWGGHAGRIQLTTGEREEYWIYSVEGKNIPTLKMHHPSSPTGKQWDYWHRVIVEFLKLKV